MTINHIALFFVFLWVACGLYAYRVTVHFFKDRYPCSTKEEVAKDRHVAVITALAGFIGLGLAFGFSHKLGKNK